MTNDSARMEISATESTIDMRRYRTYTVYKDSGISWLGKIPAHWEVKRLKHIATWNDEVLPEWTDLSRQVTYVDIGSVDSIQGIVEKEVLTFETAPSRARRIVRDGDVIISTVRTYLRAITSIIQPESNMIVSTGFAVIRPRAIRSSFAACGVRAPYFVDSVVANSVGVSYPAINSDELVRLPVVCPTDEEQGEIVAFIDRETGKIDTIVAKKARLLEMLQEKRTALITHAVTKGLDPDVPMKDSGIEWLGEIPAHWEVRVLKNIGDLQGGAGFPDMKQGDQTQEFPFFKVGDMSLGGNIREMVQYQHSVSQFTARQLRAFVFPPGTIVFAKVGAALMLNRRRILVRPSCIDNNMMGFVPRVCDPEWAMYWLSGLDMRKLANPGAVPSVNERQMQDTPVVVPPIAEQRAIASHLDCEATKIDTLVGKVQEAIDRLKELRTALISAAVTGKIDVRKAVP